MILLQQLHLGKVEKIKKYTSPEKVKYISNGFDDEFTKFEIDQELVKKYQLEKKFTIVYTGNVGLAQNLDALLDLAKAYKEQESLQFIIFGDGAYKEILASKIEEEKLNNIVLAGRIDYSKIKTILTYAKISFISLKNKKMTDSVPTKIFDALGVGCPVLLLAKGDSCDILDETGLGEHTENATQLKEKLDKMIYNYATYEEKKQNAISHIRKVYSRKAMAEKFEREVVENVKYNKEKQFI